MSGRIVVEHVPATPPFDFLYGTYHLSSWVIPYFSTVMPMRHAADNLRLVADFPGADDVRWKLDELYQRDVDWPRVERRIVPYLRDKEQPQFFNSLTIALLPTGHSLANTKQAFTTDRNWRPPALEGPDRFQKVLDVGPIRCGYWSDWNDLSQTAARTGQMRWNPDEVFAAALDGQHRLAAIQHFARNSAPAGDRLQDTLVPVIFIVLDPRVGYHAASPKSLVDVMRRIFIDLNKHAKIPTRARQILLDDKDPTSVCVHALVGDTVSGDTDDLHRAPPRLPLSLVDWHTEQAKADEGPYLTTILMLDWAIAQLLGASPVHNFMDYSAVRKQVKVLGNRLCVDMSKALVRLDGLEQGESRPFSYSEDENNNELKTIEEAFQRIWNPAFVTLLTEFTPYRDLMHAREAAESFTLDFANWYRLYHRKRKDSYEGRATTEYRRFLGRLQEGPNPVVEQTLMERLRRVEDAKGNLAYAVVFQRAYFLAFREWEKVTEGDLEDLDALNLRDAYAHERSGANDSPDDSVPAGDDPTGADVRATEIQRRAREFVEGMNDVVDRVPDILRQDCLFERDDGSRERFWMGTLVTAEGIIDFTQGASVRASEVIFWMVAMRTYDHRLKATKASGFDEFWGTLDEPDSPYYLKRIGRSVKRFAKDTSAGGRILASRGEDFDPDLSREEAEARMGWLWAAMGL